MSAAEREITTGGLKFEVRPVPSDDEAAAIVAALSMLSRDRQALAAPAESVWSRAARREGLRRELAPSVSGWRLSSRLEP